MQPTLLLKYRFDDDIPVFDILVVFLMANTMFAHVVMNCVLFVREAPITMCALKSRLRTTFIPHVSCEVVFPIIHTFASGAVIRNLASI